MSEGPAGWDVHFDGPAIDNMERDERLLDSATRPTLRLYSWARPTLSLGFAQKSDWLDHALLQREGVAWVRRPSGGRALLHDDEITYAMVLPHCSLSVAQAYRALTGWLCSALDSLGIPLASAVQGRKSERHPGCYTLIQPGELVFQGEKVIGSAQARRGSRLLQHGAIPLRVDNARLQRLMPQHPPYAGLTDLGFSLTAEQLAEALFRLPRPLV